jgi:hypothetical protein
MEDGTLGGQRGQQTERTVDREDSGGHRGRCLDETGNNTEDGVGSYSKFIDTGKVKRVR